MDLADTEVDLAGGHTKLDEDGINGDLGEQVGDDAGFGPRSPWVSCEMTLVALL